MATKKQREIYSKLCKKCSKKPHPLADKFKGFNPNEFIGEFNHHFHDQL